MQDLEIRGAGEILGEGQSGEMMQVGFTLYTECSNKPCATSKKAASPTSTHRWASPPKSNCTAPPCCPKATAPTSTNGSSSTKRLAVCETVQQINAIHEELVDRFGLPEQPVKTLIESHHLRLAAKELGIDAIDATSEAVTVTFGKHHQIDRQKSSY